MSLTNAQYVWLLQSDAQAHGICIYCLNEWAQVLMIITVMLLACMCVYIHIYTFPSSFVLLSSYILFLLIHMYKLYMLSHVTNMCDTRTVHSSHEHTQQTCHSHMSVANILLHLHIIKMTYHNVYIYIRLKTRWKQHSHATTWWNNISMQRHDDNNIPMQRHDENNIPMQRHDDNNIPMQRHDENNIPMQRHDETIFPCKDMMIKIFPCKDMMKTTFTCDDMMITTFPCKTWWHNIPMRRHDGTTFPCKTWWHNIPMQDMMAQHSHAKTWRHDGTIISCKYMME